MMGPGGITVALAMYWLTGAVGAASLPPDDQYSPHQPPYKRDVAQGPLSYPNWMKYQQDLSTRLEPPDYTSGLEKLDFSKERMRRKDTVIPDLELSPPASEGRKITGSADVIRNSSESVNVNLGIPEHAGIASVSSEDDFVGEENFQDQGPGSVEVYKLDLHRENSLLVPHDNEKRPVAGSRMKSKIPKKATAEEILWKLKSIETSKTPLPSIFRQPPRNHEDPTLPREYSGKMKKNPIDEVFAIGGVPELQVGCEGLETSERQKRSSGPDVENTYDDDDDDDDWDSSHKFRNPVYGESTDSILPGRTPIVLDLEDEEPPSGEIYEEMDELLKLKKLENTSPEPTTRRWNRGDIDPALEMEKHRERRMMVHTLPERGDLGPYGNGSGNEVKGLIVSEDSKRRELERKRFRREAAVVRSPVSLGMNVEDDKNVPLSLSQTATANRQSRRRLLWVENPVKPEHRNQVTKTRHHRAVNGHRDDSNIWGFGEDDGAVSDSEDEVEKREYDRRRQEAYRRRGHPPHSEDRSSGSDADAEIEKIRLIYETMLKKQQRERETIEEERRKIEETRRRHEEESKRRIEEERRREWNRRRDEEERRRRLEDQRNHEDPPASLTRPDSSHRGNLMRSQPDRETEDEKLRDYIERNRPIDPKMGDHRRPTEESRRTEHAERSRHIEEQRKRQMEEDQRRQRMEEDRRRQKHPDGDERRRQMEEHHRRTKQPDDRRRQMEEQRRHNQSIEEERRRQMEEQRERERPDSRAMEEERRRRLEEERKLQEYVRRNQPVNVPRRNNDNAANSSRESDIQVQMRRTLDAARQWERNRQPNVIRNDGRIHGPSAPTNIGQRHSQDELEQMRQERLEEERRRETERRRLEVEERRRELEYQRAESRRHEAERKRLEAVRREEENRRAESEGRRNPWEESVPSRYPATAPRRNDGTDEVRDWEAEELRRRQAAGRTTGNAMRNREDERRSEEGNGQRQQQEARERQRLENERNSRNNGHRRPQHEHSGPKPRQRGEIVRGGHDEIEWRRREHARLNALPVRARIILRSDDASQNGGGTSPRVISPTPSRPLVPIIGSRANYDNDIDFPVLSPNRPGLEASRFPAPATRRPPVENPSACVWAIVQCCPANNRITSCFESMGCPGVNWDPNPCRGSLADAARAQVVRFYEAADEENNE